MGLFNGFEKLINEQYPIRFHDGRSLKSRKDEPLEAFRKIILEADNDKNLKRVYRIIDMTE